MAGRPRWIPARRIRDEIKAHAQFLRALRAPAAPMIVAVLAAIAFSLPDQILEIWRDYALNISRWTLLVARQDRQWLEYLPLLQAAFGFASMFLASYLCWRLARHLMLLQIEDTPYERTPVGFVVRWLPAACGAIIPFGAGLGNVLASRSFALEQEQTILLAAAFVSFAFGLLLLLWAGLRTRSRREQPTGRPHPWLFDAPIIALFGALSLMGVLVFSAPALGSYTVRVAQLIGSPALFCLFVMVLAYWTSLFSAVRARYQIPLISAIMVWGIALAWLGWNENHEVVTEQRNPNRHPAIRDAFRSWYVGRADREAYEKAGKPYPVFLVSAAGGGLYAADFAATALGRIQDRCPGFAQHVFAISGVSGGGLGAAVFTRLIAGEAQVTAGEMRPGSPDPCLLAQDRPRNRLSIEDQARLFHWEDFLAPIAGAGFFPDFLQRVLPVPIGMFDRSRAFDKSLDARWQSMHAKIGAPGCGGDCAPFSQPFLHHWRADGAPPALVLNATDADLGYRVVIAPFAVTPLPTSQAPVYVPSEYSALTDFHSVLPNKDVPLGTAIGISARFPWLLPPATFTIAGGSGSVPYRRVRLLDGGLFENSGAETVGDMLYELADFERARPGEPWVVFHPIVISGYRLNLPERSYNFKGELLAPVTAMLNTRVQRAGLTSYRLFKRRGYHCGRASQVDLEPFCNVAGGIRFLVLNHQDHRLPLGWHLSKHTRDVIEQHIGDAKRCEPIPKIARMFVGEAMEERKRDTILENNCTACAILSALRSRSLEENRLCR